MKELFNRFVFIKEIHKINPEENENKFFKVAIERINEDYITWTHWGRIGSLGQAPQSRYRGEDLKEAFKVAFGKLNEKFKEGYQEIYDIEPDNKSPISSTSKKVEMSKVRDSVIEYFEREMDLETITDILEISSWDLQDYLIQWVTPEVYDLHDEYINHMLPEVSVCLEIAGYFLENDMFKPIFDKYNGQYSYIQIRLIKALYIKEQILCPLCGKQLNDTIRNYCNDYKERFNSHSYCNDCQKIFT